MAIGSSFLARPHFAQRGFTYLGLMFLIAAIGIGLAAAGTVWQTEVRREREKELLFVGNQYAMAIGSYYESTPGGPKQYPVSLEDLLQDNRFPVIRRHLRKLYYDPVTGDEEWGLAKQQGRITGVYSLARQQPLKTAGFPPQWEAFANAENYAGWQFIYAPGTLQATQATSPDAAGSANTFPPVQTINQASDNSGQSGKTGLQSQSGDQTAEGGQAAGANPNPDSPDGVDYTKQQACLGQRVSDTAACTFYCKAKGVGTECRQCQASILSRYNACLKGDSLPPLEDRS